MQVRDYQMCMDARENADGDWLLCILAVGHARMHQSADGTVWTRLGGDRHRDGPLCQETARSVPPGEPDWECVLNEGHQGHHSTAGGGDWHRMRVLDA